MLIFIPVFASSQLPPEAAEVAGVTGVTVVVEVVPASLPLRMVRSGLRAWVIASKVSATREPRRWARKGAPS